MTLTNAFKCHFSFISVTPNRFGGTTTGHIFVLQHYTEYRSLFHLSMQDTNQVLCARQVQMIAHKNLPNVLASEPFLQQDTDPLIAPDGQSCLAASPLVYECV